VSVIGFLLVLAVGVAIGWFVRDALRNESRTRGGMSDMTERPWQEQLRADALRRKGAARSRTRRPW
jgi:hypothetical protein